MKKLLSMFIVVVMLMSMFSVTSFAEGTVTIDGDSIIYKIPHTGETAYVTYSATLDGASADFVYSLVGEPAGVSIDSATGKLAVTSDAPASVTVKAALKSDETVFATKDITVNTTSVIDFTTSEPKHYFWTDTANSNDNGNYYFDPAGKREDTTGLGYVRNNGPKNPVGTQSPVNAYTIELDTKITTARIDNNPEFVFVGEAGNGASNNWYGYIYFKNLSEDGTTAEIIYNNGKDYSMGVYDINTWLSLKFAIDNKSNSVKGYVNDVPTITTTEIHTNTEWSNFTLSLISVYTAVDNMTTYTGVPAELTPTVAINGADTIYKTPNEGETTYFGGYSATLNGYSVPFIYSLKENYTDVSVDAQSGKLAVGYNAPESVILVASYMNNSEIKAEKTISISAPYIVDFSDTADQDIFDDWCWDTKKYGTVTSSGYVNVNNDLYTKNSFCPVAPAGTDSFTVEFDMLLTSSNLDDGDWRNGFNLRGMSSNASGVWETFELTAYNEATDKVTLTSLAGSLGYYDNGTWATIKVAVNDAEGYYDIYVNGEYKIRKQYSGVSYYLMSLRFWKNVNFDNIKVYSGIAKASIKSDIDNIYIPASGKSANAHLTISGATGETVVWSMANDYTGVSVNSGTGVVTVTSEATDGSVIVNATNTSGMLLASYSLNIRNAEFDGTTATGFTDAEVKTYDNQTVLYAKWDNLYYSFAKDELKGRFVAEGTFLATDGKQLAISTAMHGQSSFITWAPEYTTNRWIDFKIIVDTQAKTVTSILDGKIYNKANMDFVMNDANADVSISHIIIKCTYLKNFKLYTAGDSTPPEVYEAKVESVNVGRPLAASYKYVSEAGLSENCSIITWYKGDGSTSYTAVGENYTPTAADVGSYFKAAIQPASDEIKGAVVETDAVELKKPMEFTTEHINITTGSGVTNKLTPNGVISSVTISKTFTADEATAYVALYDNSGSVELKAISAVTIPQSMSVGSSAEFELTNKITLPEDVTNYVAKVIIINNELKPLAKPYECDDSQKQLIIMGDSIFQDYHLTEEDTGAMTGVGEVIGDYLTDNIVVVNRAYSGHTTEKYLNYTSFEETGYDEMYTWEKIKPLINSGDMIIVTLGINDEGKQIPYNDYMANLGTFVTEANALGAEVIIGTPTLTVFNNNMIEKTYDNRADKAIEAAITYGAPYIDINTTAYNDFIKNGNNSDIVTEIRENYYLHSGIEGYEDKPDYCHLSEGGARYYASIIAKLINSTDSGLSNYIKVK